MKKYLSLLLAGTMAISCTACGNNEASENFDPESSYEVVESDFDDYYESDFIKFPISSTWESDDMQTEYSCESVRFLLPNYVKINYSTSNATLKDLKECPDEDTLYYNIDDDHYIYTIVRGGYTYQFDVFKGGFSSSDLVKPLANYIASNASFKKEQPNPTEPPTEPPTEAPTPKPTEPPTPKPTEPPTPEPTTIDPAVIEQEYKAKCQALTYKDLARDRDGLKGEYVTFTGEIIQDVGDGSYRMNVTAEGTYSTYYTDTIIFYYDDKGVGDRLLEDDIITIWGTSGGLYSYETVLGDTVTVPLVYVEYVELVQG